MEKGLKLKILKLRKKGLTYNEIKNELNCSKGTISYHCRKNGMSDFNMFVVPSKDEISLMQKIYDECGSYKKVSEKVKWSSSTVLKYIKTIKKNKQTKEERKKSVSKSVTNWRRRTKQKLVDYKGGKCIVCDYNKSLRAMEFHHLDPSEKDFSISGKSWSYEKLRQESDKCILVCNRCHAEIHDNIINVNNYI